MSFINSEISVREVANKAGVSTASVSLVYHDPERVGEGVKKKVLAAAQELGYVPKFVKKRSSYGNIGILIDKNRGPFGEFYSHIILGVLEEAKKQKWNISFETYDSFSNEFPPMLMEKKVDGVLLLSKQDDEYIKVLINRKIPYCVADYESEKITHNFVRPDWKQGAKLATEYLVRNGHTLIAMVHSSLEKGLVSLARVDGYNEVLEKNEIPFQQGFMCDGKFNYQESYQQVKKLLKLSPRPTAIFCATDVMAMGAYKAIQEAKLKIPQDISVVGFDNIELPYYMDPLDPPLTTIDGGKEELGKQALLMVQDQVIKKLTKSKKVILKMKLIERSSVRKLN